ncbi:MAG TPA: hypothetical protein PLP27_05600 [Crocinitomicaceae bacterium]|nr:hypothetical protein [Crocinitomicaceae bacterium]
MAVNEYIITIASVDGTARYKVRYRNGKFSRLEHVYGELSKSRHEKLMLLCPPLEQQMPEVVIKYKTITVHQVEKVKSTHELFIGKYCEWYEQRFGLQPIIKPMDAAALKFVKNELIKLAGTDEEAVVMWDIILLNWDKQDKWYTSQTELPQIKRNLNIILKTLKNGKSTEQTGRNAKNVSDDYRQKF